MSIDSIIDITVGALVGAGILLSYLGLDYWGSLAIGRISEQMENDPELKKVLREVYQKGFHARGEHSLMLPEGPFTGYAERQLEKKLL